MRFRPRLAVLFAPMALFAVALAGCLPPPPAPAPPTTTLPTEGPDVAVMGASRLTADQLVAYFEQHAPSTQPYRATGASLQDLASMFITEGARYNVRGDIAFAQSIVETGWFYYPDSGIVRPSDNNFAGIGACSSCGDGYQFSSALAGVRAQMQLLRNYADSTSLTSTIPDPPVPELWGSTPATAAYNFDHYFAKGRAPLWKDLGNGNWAASPDYATIVLNVYNQMLAASS